GDPICHAVTLSPRMAKQNPQSLRRNKLPAKLIDRALLMRHEHLTGSLVELREITKTAACADGVLHHAPEAFDGVDVMTTMGRQAMKAKLVYFLRTPM